MRRRAIPITSDMVSLWVPDGYGWARDLIRDNHGTAFGTHPNVSVISPPIDQISACDAVTDWSGTSLSIDTGDKKEGAGSLKNTIATPVALTNYSTSYNPDAIWDLSEKEYILLWVKCDRASTAFTLPRLGVLDTSANYRWWSLAFSAGEWTALKLLLSTGNGESATPPDLALIDKVEIIFGAKDTTAFYKKIDDVRVTGHPSLINPSVGWHFGGDDYVNLGSGENLNPGEGDFTMGAWIKRKNVSTAQERIFIKREGILKWYELYLSLNSSNVRTSIAINSPTISAVPVDSETAIRDTAWHCVGSVFDRDAYGQIYVDGDPDGLPVDISSNAGNLNPASNVYIGAFGKDYDPPYQLWFNGYIAFPFLIKGLWSQAQWKNFYNATKGLFAPRG